MTATKPLPLFDITPLELNGFLFVEFPSNLTLQQSRALLEKLIRRVGYTEITPGTIYIAMHAERMRLIAQLPEEVRKRKIEEAWARRTARTATPTRTRTPEPAHAPAKAAAINPEEWSF